MVVGGGANDCAVTGSPRLGHWKSHERAWSRRWKLALALHRGHVVDSRFPMAARIDGEIQASCEPGVKRKRLTNTPVEWRGLCRSVRMTAKTKLSAPKRRTRAEVKQLVAGFV